MLCNSRTASLLQNSTASAAGREIHFPVYKLRNLPAAGGRRDWNESMPRSRATRETLLRTATEMLLKQHATTVSIEKICQHAKVTKKTFYYHFKSKDHMLEIVVQGLQNPYRAAFDTLASEAGPGASMHMRVQSLLKGLARESTSTGWNASYFLGLASELGNRPGHPARKLAAQSNAGLQDWLAAGLEREGDDAAANTAGQLLVLINGLIVTLVVHRNPQCLAHALQMAAALVPPRGTLQPQQSVH